MMEQNNDIRMINKKALKDSVPFFTESKTAAIYIDKDEDGSDFDQVRAVLRYTGKYDDKASLTAYFKEDSFGAEDVSYFNILIDFEIDPYEADAENTDVLLTTINTLIPFGAFMSTPSKNALLYRAVVPMLSGDADKRLEEIERAYDHALAMMGHFSDEIVKCVKGKMSIAEVVKSVGR